MRFAPLLIVSLLAGCSGHLASSAGKGAVQGAAQGAQQLPPEQKAEVGVQIGRNLTRAVLDELSQPESQRKLAALVSLATTQTLQTVSAPRNGNPEWVQPNLPPPESPNPSLDDLAARVGRAGIVAALDELGRHPELAHGAGREIARGALEGAAGTVQVVNLLVGFAGGALAVLLVGSLLRLLRPRRPPVEVHRRSV